MTDDERVEKSKELLRPWLMQEARLLAKRYGQDLKWGDWTEDGFYVRYAGKRVHVDVAREHLEDYPVSDPTDQELVRKQIRGNLEAALA